MNAKPIAGPQFEPVMTRLKEELRLESYADVGRLLGLTSSAYANRKKSNSIPFEPLITVAYSHELNLQWLLFGEGMPRLHVDRPSALSAEVNGRLLQKILIALDEAWPSFSSDNDRLRRIEVGRRAGIAALIYNKVSALPDGPVLDAAIRANARDFASVVHLVKED